MYLQTLCFPREPGQNGSCICCCVHPGRNGTVRPLPQQSACRRNRKRIRYVFDSRRETCYIVSVVVKVTVKLRNVRKHSYAGLVIDR